MNIALAPRSNGALISPIPVQRLRSGARSAYLEHLAALDAGDRRLRFAGSLSNVAVAAYVERINLDGDVLFGVYGDQLSLQGVAHLAIASGFAELGVSVLPRARRKGIGGTLMLRAVEFARNRRITRLNVCCVAENMAMIRLARRIGMLVAVESGEVGAHVDLPPASLVSVISEFVGESVALFDYALRTNVETSRRIGVAFAQSSKP